MGLSTGNADGWPLVEVGAINGDAEGCALESTGVSTGFADGTALVDAGPQPMGSLIEYAHFFPLSKGLSSNTLHTSGSSAKSSFSL